MSGLMSPEVMKMRELLSLLQPNAERGGIPQGGPAGVDRMIMGGAGGPQAAGLWQAATGRPVGAFQGGPQAPPAANPYPPAPQEPQMNPALRALMLQFMKEAPICDVDKKKIYHENAERIFKI